MNPSGAIGLAQCKVGLTREAARQSMTPSSTDLIASSVRIVQDGVTKGAGFLTHGNVIVTASHVLDSLENAYLTFHVAPDIQFPVSSGDDGHSRWPQADVLLLRLDGRPPAGAHPLTLGIPRGEGYDIETFGYPRNGPIGGRRAIATVLGETYDARASALHGSVRLRVLQMADNGYIDKGFSGAPVVDSRSGLAVGVVIGIDVGVIRKSDLATAASWSDDDPIQRMPRAAASSFATPMDLLLSQWPSLSVPLPNPYLGLATFKEDDSERFFGRKSIVDVMHSRITRSPRLLTLLGPSGSGKSSLLQAGLTPRIRVDNDKLVTVVVRPGSTPKRALLESGLMSPEDETLVEAMGLRRSVSSPACLLILDQFEEFLAAYSDGAESRSHTYDFLGDLGRTINMQDPNLFVAIAVRDDFYPELIAADRRLTAILVETIVNVPARLTREELDEIVRGPADRQGWPMERGVADLVVGQVLGDRPDAPSTVLPVLQTYLHRLAASSTDSTLTKALVDRSGGVEAAMATWADESLSALPSDGHRLLARDLMLSLVSLAHPDRAIPAIRRRRDVQQLVLDATASGVERADIELVIDSLARSRVLLRSSGPERPSGTSEPQPAPTSGRDAGQAGARAELAHEALIHAWPQLREWIEEDRDFRRWLEPMEQRAAAYLANQDSSELLGAPKLVESAGWAREYTLPPDVRRLIRDSRQRQRRHRHRVRLVQGAIVTLLVTSLVATGLSWRQGRHLAEQSEAALAQGLAARASAQSNDRPDLAALLAAESLRRSDGPANLNGAIAALGPVTRSGDSVSTGGRRVTAMAAIPGGDLLATAQADGTMSLWNWRSRHLLRTTIPGQGGSILSLAVRSDGRVLATGGIDGTVRLWDARSAEAITEPITGHVGAVLSLAFAPSGQTLFSGGADGAVLIWNLQDRNSPGQPVTNVLGAALSIATSADGKRLAIGTSDHSVFVWDLPNWRLERQFTEHLSDVTVVVFASNTILLSGSTDRTIREWDLKNGVRRGEPWRGHDSAVRTLAVREGGRTVVSSGDDGTVRTWSPETGHETEPPVRSHETGTALVLVQGTASMATAGPMDTWRLWSSERTSGLAVVLRHSGGSVGGISFSPDGRFLAAASSDNTLSMWDVTTQRQVWHVVAAERRGLSDVTFMPDGRSIITVGGDGALSMWSARAGKLLAAANPRSGELWGVAASPDGRIVATAGADHLVRLWDVRSLHQVSELPGHEDQVDKVDFSPDGHTLASSGKDRTIRLWNVSTGDQIGEPLTGHTNFVWDIAFSPNGKLLASTGADGTIRIWDILSQRARQTLRVDSATDGVAFSPDGDRIASSGADRLVRIWDVDSGSELHEPLIGHRAWTDDVAYSPDGKILASASDDGQIRLWDLDYPDWLGRLCRRAGRNLTTEEWARYVGADLPWRATCPGLASPRALGG